MEREVCQFVDAPPGRFKDPAEPGTAFVKLFAVVEVSGPKNALVAGNLVTGTSYRFFEDSHPIVPID